MNIKEIGYESVCGLDYLVWDRVNKCALVYMVINFEFHRRWGISWPAEQLTTYQTKL
jgi:hypothetical protein